MKKTYIKIIAAVLTLVAVLAVAFGCNKVTDPDIVEVVKSYYQEAVNATTINQSVVVKNGETLLSSKVIEYVIAADKSVTGKQTVTTLNPDVTASELYVVETNNINISSENSAAALPTSITLNRSDFEDGKCTYTIGDTHDTFTFELDGDSIQSFFGLTEAEADDIDDVNVTILIKDKKVIEYKATYSTDNGNSVEIKISFTYAA